MTSSNSSPQGPIFWERLRGLFRRDEEDAEAGDDSPRSRGLAIALCVLVSFVLWFTFTLQETYTAVIEVPTRVVELPDGQALAALPPQTARVQVQGEGLELLRLKVDPVALVVDAESRQVDLGQAILPNLPQSIQVEAISPRFIELQTEPRVTRRVPLRLRADIETPATHALVEAPQLRPDSVLVSGAQSIVETLDYWPTDTLRVTGLRDSLNVQVALADTLSGLVTTSTQATRVVAAVRQYTEGNRELEVRVPGGPVRAVTLVPPVIHVRYRVPVSQYQEAQEAADFFATVSYDQIRTDTTGRLRPNLHVPADLDIRDIEVTPPTLQYYHFIGLD